METTWAEVFKPDLIKKGFEKCGIFPLDESRYPTEAFGPSLLALYNAEKAHSTTVSSDLLLASSFIAS